MAFKVLYRWASSGQVQVRLRPATRTGRPKQGESISTTARRP